MAALTRRHGTHWTSLTYLERVRVDGFLYLFVQTGQRGEFCIETYQGLSATHFDAF
jgi:hypothetical protein